MGLAFTWVVPPGTKVEDGHWEIDPNTPDEQDPIPLAKGRYAGDRWLGSAERDEIERWNKDIFVGEELEVKEIGGKKVLYGPRKRGEYLRIYNELFNEQSRRTVERLREIEAAHKADLKTRPWNSLSTEEQLAVIAPKVIEEHDKRRTFQNKGQEYAGYAMIVGGILTGLARGIMGLTEQQVIRGVESGAQQEVRFFRSFDILKSKLGPAGEGKVWHHIVEKRAANIEKFGAEAIHNTQNAVPVSSAVNQAIADYYSSVRPSFTGGQRVRQWLESQSWREQFEFGQKILNRALAGQPLP
ncbi:MAG: hypothetical protein NTW87_11700 [Planctomycetota bacterium]|nr:hypothetical protein [Planctomycetota bacterium]